MGCELYFVLSLISENLTESLKEALGVSCYVFFVHFLKKFEFPVGTNKTII